MTAEGGFDSIKARLDQEASVVKLPGADQEERIVQLRNIEFDAFLDLPDPEYNWLVEDLLERMDRVMLTGGEGGGKSTLLRQLAVQLASGIHPFTLDPIPPLNVVLVDFENSEAQTRRKMRPLRLVAKDAYRDRLHLVIVPEGVDLVGNANDRAWMEAEIADAFPVDPDTEQGGADVVIVGPVYKMADGDPSKEEVVRPLQKYLDQLRTAYGFAVIIEAHSGHAANGAKHRPIRPIGSSAWLRWPEFGLHLGAEGTLEHWRGQRDEREWPALLKRGGTWPWSPSTNPKDVLWSRVVGWVHEHGRVASSRQLGEELGSSSSAIHRVLQQHATDWEQLKMTLGEVPE